MALHNDAGEHRQHAQRLREVARRTDELIQGMLLDLAREYDRLADALDRQNSRQGATR